jgi:DMSO/TMAO reductase YedYZ molybdopterin-dependent catalytic subunit
LKPPAEWTIRIHGEVKNPRQLALKELMLAVESRGTVLMECAGNARELRYGLLSVADWSGIPIQKVIDSSGPTAKAKRILINGYDEHTAVSTHSTPTCSWIFSFDELLKAKAIFATELNGRTLPPNQGAPVRLLVPGWYGCSEVKWVDEIKFVDDEEAGTLQMREFAPRTLQTGVPELARDYHPATIDQAALPVRVEQWISGDKVSYRIVGITWGGPSRTNRLKIRFIHDHPTPFAPIDFCAIATTNPEYGIWCHRWEPAEPGPYRIQVRVDKNTSPARKQSLGHYDRVVKVPSGASAS